MRKKVVIIVRKIVGALLVLFGVVGLALPILQGALLMVIGLYILSLDSLWFRGKLDKLVSRDVRVATLYHKIDKTIRRIFKIENHHVPES